MTTARTATQTVTLAVQALGYDRICPESLEDLKQQADDWTWHSVAARANMTGMELSAAYRELMAGFRALFAPL